MPGDFKSKVQQLKHRPMDHGASLGPQHSVLLTVIVHEPLSTKLELQSCCALAVWYFQWVKFLVENATQKINVPTLSIVT
jgi:hypothetical protein